MLGIPAKVKVVDCTLPLLYLVLALVHFCCFDSETLKTAR
jgi:hypothetical protein